MMKDKCIKEYSNLLKDLIEFEHAISSIRIELITDRRA